MHHCQLTLHWVINSALNYIHIVCREEKVTEVAVKGVVGITFNLYTM